MAQVEVLRVRGIVDGQVTNAGAVRCPRYNRIIELPDCRVCEYHIGMISNWQYVECKATGKVIQRMVE